MEPGRIMLLGGSPEWLAAAVEGPAAFEGLTGYRVAEGMLDYLAQAPSEWIERMVGMAESVVWWHGFWVVDKQEGLVVGTCGFNGPPDDHGLVEIAYAVAPGYQGRGIATEAARAATIYAIRKNGVRRVIAHTLPETSASTRVLTKCNYERVGTIEDPDDGPVWRWEFGAGRR